MVNYEKFKLPVIHRARDSRLYDIRGNRYLDLWRNGGRALLGHRPDLVYRELKSALQKGILAEYPSLYLHRLKKALQTLIPGNWEVRVFATLDQAFLHIQELSTQGERLKVEQQEPNLPLVSTPYRGVVYYRPFLKVPYPKYPIVVPILPFPGGFAPQPVLFGEPLQGEPLPSDDAVSPVLLAAVTRTIWNLIKGRADSLPLWENWHLHGWKRESCYCIPQFELSTYTEVFHNFLKEKIIIPPEPGDPLVLPMQWSKGEKALVEKVARTVCEMGG